MSRALIHIDRLKLGSIKSDTLQVSDVAGYGEIQTELKALRARLNKTLQSDDQRHLVVLEGQSKVFEVF
jgi:hypothetical protein